MFVLSIINRENFRQLTQTHERISTMTIKGFISEHEKIRYIYIYVLNNYIKNYIYISHSAESLCYVTASPVKGLPGHKTICYKSYFVCHGSKPFDNLHRINTGFFNAMVLAWFAHSTRGFVCMPSCRQRTRSGDTHAIALYIRHCFDLS